MDIPENQISYKKQVGKIGEIPVFMLGTIGGLHLVVAARKGKAEVLGAGPHEAISRHVAKKKEEGITWTDLEKGNYIAPQYFVDLLPQYEALTDAFRKRQGF